MTATTGNQDLAVYLCASKRMRFLGCEPSGDNRVLFLFEGTSDDLAAIEREYISGVQYSAYDLFKEMRRLRRLVTESKSERH
jgi:hypothetical protein